MKKYLFFNFKNKPNNPEQLRELISVYNKYAKSNFKKVLLPPTLYLMETKQNVSSQFALGAQDVFWMNKVTVTGEITPLMLKSLGVQYVLIGHSERRNYLSENNILINLKLKTCLANKLIPVLCVGEKLRSKNDKEIDFRTKKEIFDELNYAFREIQLNSSSNLIIAYEPQWSIGKGEGNNRVRAEAVGKLIRFWMARRFSESFAQSLIVLYGGSVNASNIKDYLNLQDISGVLIGGGSANKIELNQIFKQLTNNKE
ncbi:MAG: triose-phosphate isomerase [Minisyncoccia bacterium]